MEESSPELVQTEARSVNTTHEKSCKPNCQQQELFSSQKWLRPNN